MGQVRGPRQKKWRGASKSEGLQERKASKMRQRSRARETGWKGRSQQEDLLLGWGVRSQ